MESTYQILNATFKSSELEPFEFNDVQVLTAEDDLATYVLGTCQELNEYIKFEILSMVDMPTWQFNYLLNVYNQAIKDVQAISEKIQPKNLISMAVYSDDNKIIITNVDIEIL